MKTRKIKSIKRLFSLVLALCLIFSVFSATVFTTGAAAEAVKADNMGDYVCADFSNNRFFTIKGVKLYLYDMKYGSGYEVFDYSQLSNDASGLKLLDVQSVGKKIYALFSDSQQCYLNVIDLTVFSSFTNILGFTCEKFVVLDNGDIIITTINGNADYLFRLKASGDNEFYNLSEHIDEFYGAVGSRVYYKTSRGMSYGDLSDSAFTQSSDLVNGVSIPDNNRTDSVEFFNNEYCAANTGEFYSVSNNGVFDKKATFNREGYTESSGSLTSVLSGSKIIITANGQNNLTAFDLNTYSAVSSVSTKYMPYCLYANDSGILCVEKNGNDYYYESFNTSDFVAIEPSVINLNDESIYSGRTKEDIALMYSAAIGGANLFANVLSANGSTQKPYVGSVVDSNAQTTLLDFSNYLRCLGGLSDYSYGGDDTAATVGKGAILLSAVKDQYTGHQPPRPSDMDEVFYNEAYSVCGGNISYGHGSTVYNQIESIRSLADDVNNASNQEIDMGGYHQGYNTPGHRNCFLQRGGNKLTYGYADGVLLQYYEYAQRNPNATGTIIETGNNEAAYAWPSPGAFPLEEIDVNAVWTLYFNTDLLDLGNNNPVITITDLTTGDTFVRDTEMHDADGQREGFSTSNLWGKCISFTPPKADSFSDKSYKVTVENLVDGNKMPATVEYTINFFDYNGEYTINGQAFNMDIYGNLSPVTPVTEPVTTVPETVEPSTAEMTTVEPSTAEPTTVEPSTANPATEPTTNPYFGYLIGDVNFDKSVDVLDAVIIHKYSVEKTNLDTLQRYVADVNDDGNIDVLDALDIQKYCVDKISEFKKKNII